MTVRPVTSTLKIPADLRRSMFGHAERAFPDECCGAIFGVVEGDERQIIELREMDNAWDPVERRRRFLITPEEYMRVEREADEQGLTLIGFYHSHPNAEPRPSEFDREHAWPWFAYPIVGVRDGNANDIRAWQLRDDRAGYIELAIVVGDD